MTMPDQVTGELYVYSEDGVVEVGATIEMRFRNIAGTGLSVSTAIRTETSDANGLVSFTNLFVGGEYEFRREANGICRTVTIPTDASSPYSLPNFWGIDE